MRAFEARLQELKHRMESGLVDRAEALRDLAGRVENGDEAARKTLKTEGHKLRGIAGSYGHEGLGDLAGQLEQRASVSPPAAVGELARELADAAERAGRASLRHPPAPPMSPAPAAPSAHERTVSERPHITSDEGRPLRVLAMDDDPVTLKLLSLTLKNVGGFEAEVVDSAEKALELLKSQQFDVVVSDAMMPDMDGREFCEAARAIGADLPIIILSAAAREELGWELKGPHAWLRKPFSPSSLVHDIARNVEANRD